MQTKGMSGLILLLGGGLVLHKLISKHWIWENLAAKRTSLAASQYVRRLPVARRPQPKAATPGMGMGATKTVYTPADPSGEVIQIINR